MVPDLQSSMKELREANADFTALLTQLKQFISGEGPITVMVGGTSYTFPSIPSLIRDYRGGVFDSVVIGSGGSAVTLVVHDGALQVLGKDGNVASLEVATLKYSSIEACTLGSATVEDCHIGQFDAGEVTAKAADVETVSAGTLDAGSIMAHSLNASELDAEEASLLELHVGHYVYVPRDTADLFKEGGTTYSYSVSNAQFVQAGPHNNWKCSLPRPAGGKAPETMGFKQLPADGDWSRTAPDMMAYNGSTTYNDYARGLSVQLSNFYVMGTGPLGAQAIMANTQSPVQIGTIGDSSPGLPFAMVLGWPLRSYVPDTSVNAAFPQNANGIGILHEISAEDIGHIVYIRTEGELWLVPRLLEVKYIDGKPHSAALGLPCSVPPYTCLRMRLNRYTVEGDGYTLYRNVLELT